MGKPVDSNKFVHIVNVAKRQSSHYEQIVDSILKALRERNVTKDCWNRSTLQKSLGVWATNQDPPRVWSVICTGMCSDRRRRSACGQTCFSRRNERQPDTRSPAACFESLGKVPLFALCYPTPHTGIPGVSPKGEASRTQMGTRSEAWERFCCLRFATRYPTQGSPKECPKGRRTEMGTQTRLRCLHFGTQPHTGIPGASPKGEASPTEMVIRISN